METQAIVVRATKPRSLVGDNSVLQGNLLSASAGQMKAPASSQKQVTIMTTRHHNLEGRNLKLKILRS
jgi:hypothetical protein